MLFLITGAEGQLGIVLQEKLGNSGIYCSRAMCDITNIESIKASIKKYNPDIVINCAAYTNVEKAEHDDKDLCFAVNAEGVKNIAKSCAEFKIPLMHISTDYVFDGENNSTYIEEDIVNPINNYGQSKLLGKKYFFEYAYSGAIIRTSYLYSKYGNNIVKTFVNLLSTRENITAVDNQNITITYAPDLADAIIKVAVNINGKVLYNYSAKGNLTFVELAEFIKNKIDSKCVINKCSLSEYKSNVKRPLYSALDSSKIMQEHSVDIKNWQESLEKFLQ